MLELQNVSVSFSYEGTIFAIAFTLKKKTSALKNIFFKVHLNVRIADMGPLACRNSRSEAGASLPHKITIALITIMRCSFPKRQHISARLTRSWVPLVCYSTILLTGLELELPKLP